MSSAKALMAGLRDLRRFWPAPGSLGRQLLVWYGATLAVVVAGVSATLYAALLHEVAWVDDQVLDRKFQAISALIQTESERDYWLGHEVSEDLEGPRRLFIRVIAASGEVLAETPGMAELAPASVFPGRRASSITGPGGQRLRALVAHADWGQSGTQQEVLVQLAADTSLDNVVYARYARTLLIVVLATLLICMAAGIVLLARLLSPLHRIADEIAAVNLESLDKPILTDGLTGELQGLASRFNAMMARLAGSYTGLRYYADNVAHELRTPLNKLRLSLEITRMRARTEAEYRDIISNAAQDCSELSHLIDRLLFLARASNKQASLAKQELDLQAELERVREYFDASAADAQIVLTLEAAESLLVSVDRTLLQRAITNLMANALAHTPPGGTITLSARRAGELALIEVRDSGAGISIADLPHVFERFYRGDAARTTSDGRVGLGLAITKGIIELHDGWITLESTLGKGTLATMALPIITPDQSGLAQAAA